MELVSRSFRATKSDKMRISSLVAATSGTATMADVIRDAVSGAEQNPPASWAETYSEFKAEKKSATSGSPVGCFVNQEEFEAVSQEIKTSLDLQRVRTALVLRLCIYTAFLRAGLKNQESIELPDDLEIVIKVAEALKSDNDESIRVKILDVIKDKGEN